MKVGQVQESLLAADRTGSQWAMNLYSAGVTLSFTPEQLAAYLAKFDPTFIRLRGEAGELNHVC